MRRISYYYRTKAEFEQYYFRLKQASCPHCKQVGFLIRHGYLPVSYEEHGTSKKSRGRRIYCSNRKLRNGCGKTFSAISSAILKGFIISSPTLWMILTKRIQGLNLKKSFDQAGLSFSTSWIYWIWHKWRINQSRLRTFFYSLKTGSFSYQNVCAEIETILYLKAVFPTPNPIASFQACFQQPLFQ